MLSEESDPDPCYLKGRIRIHVYLKGRIRVYVKGRIRVYVKGRIRVYVRGRIRIRDYVKGRIRICTPGCFASFKAVLTTHGKQGNS